MRTDKEEEEEIGIQQRLLANDPIAPEEFARKYLPQLRDMLPPVRWLSGVWNRELINDATVDAVFNHIRHPEKFDPKKSGLLGYVKRAAEFDLINVVKKDRRRRRGEKLHENVEEFIRLRNKSSELSQISHGSEDDEISRIHEKRELAKSKKELADISAGCSDQDNMLLELIADGERSTSKFAKVLGIEGRPIQEQRRIVKQHKDRLKIQVKRERRTRREG